MNPQPLYNLSELLDVLAQTAGTPGDLDNTLQHIARTALTFFVADSCVIFAINPITGRFIASLTAAGTLLRGEKVSYKEPSEGGLAQQVLRQGVVVVEDLEVKPEYQSTVTRTENMRAFAALALYTRHQRQPLGVLYLNFRQPQQFSLDDYKLLQIFADQASFILQETWLLRRYQEVARIGQEINHELGTIDILFQKLQKYLPDVLQTTYALLLAVYQPQTNTLDVYLEEEGKSVFQFNSPLEGACQHVIETREMLFIKHLDKEAEHLPFQPIEITATGSKESLIFVPLELRDTPLGVLSIQHPQPNNYNQEDLSILQLLAPHIALALHNIGLYNSLVQLNKTGQFLTQQLDSEQALQATVDKIRDAAKADIVVLYPYDHALRRFILPPIITGTVIDSTIQSMSPNQSDDTMALMVQLKTPIFAKDSDAFYTKLHGNSYVRRGSFGQREMVRSIAALPLQIGDELVGVLFVNFRQPQRFDATQKLFIDGLAHFAAVAVKNARVFGTLTQRRVRELEILQDIDRELSRNLELQPVLDTLLKLGHERVPADGASILLYDSRTKALVTTATIGQHAISRKVLIVPVQASRGITRWVLEQKKAARVSNVHLDPLWRDIYISASSNTVSELDVPLLDGDEVVGVLNFESTKEGAFDQEDEDFLLTLAGQAVLAVKNAQAYEREKRLAAEAQVLNEISKEITSQLDLTRVFDLILEKALELTHSHMGNLMLYDPEMGDLWVAAERGVLEEKKDKRQNLGQGVVGHVAKDKQLLNIADVTQSPWNKIFLRYIYKTRSEIAVPMLAGSDLRGVLNVESPDPNNFSESDERLLQGLAALAVVALQNAQAYEREKRLAAEAQVLNEISKEITSQLDLSRVFDLILEKALKLTNSNLGNLMLYDPDQNDFGMAAERGVAEDKKGQRQRMGQGVVGHAARDKQLLNVDLTQQPWKDIYLEFFPGARYELAVPMLSGDVLWGVLNIERPVSRPVSNKFSESDERLLTGLASLAVVALQNAQAYEQAKKEVERFELLYQAGQELGKISELSQREQTYDIILNIAEKYCNGQIVIRRYEGTTQELIAIRASYHQYSPPFSRMKLDEGINGQVARERRTIVIHDTNRPPPDVVPAKLSDPTVRSLIITPIIFEERYYGNLGLGHKEVGRFRDADVHFLEGLTQQLASTIYRLETVQERQEFEQRIISAEAMSSIGQIAFELTHRWGNDLGLVRSYVNDIRTELKSLHTTSPLITEKLENIVGAAGAVLNLSKELKQALVRTGEAFTGEPVVIEARILLEEALDTASLPANIQICLEIDADVAAVRVIHSLVADILRNLMTNAIDAMSEGGKITLRAHNAGRFVALEVIDTGVGIPQQNLSKIFDLFYSTKGSSGFGLWSAHTNALRNQGDLMVKSQEGQGTTFTLLLPGVERQHDGAI
ncbi:MAG TPA: GAF domain-containing protein [Ktedonobacteraceae bacterium]|nr:GAF domain-containing protein [Ktedonobacteraceae bacterium]